MTILGEIFETLDWLEETQPEDFNQQKGSCCVVGMNSRRQNKKNIALDAMNFLASPELPHTIATELYGWCVPAVVATDVNFCVAHWRNTLRAAAPAAYWAHKFKNAVKRGIPRPFVAKQAVAQPVLGGAIA